MSTTQILNAALERLEIFQHSPQPPIVWPGIQEEPPQEGMWLRPGFFPNDPVNIAWDEDSCVESRGFFQVLVYFRPGNGTVEPATLADNLIRFFPKGLQLGPVRIRKRAWQALAVTEDASKLFIPVTIPYLGLT